MSAEVGVDRAEPARAKRRAHGWLALLALTVLLGVALWRLDVPRAFAVMQTANVGWLLLAVIAFAAILPLWALQWWLLAPAGLEATRRRMLEVVATTSSVLNTTPMLVGEATAVVLLVARAGLTRASALSVLAMDQLLVGLAKLVVLATASLLLPIPVWMRDALFTLFAAVSLLFAALVSAAWSSVALSARIDRLTPPRWRGRLGSVGDTLAPLRSMRRGGGAFLLALAKKVAEIAGIVCVQHAFAVDLPLASAVLVLATLNLATLLPVVPGNVGVYEAAVVFAYTRLGIPAERALGIAVVQHACYFAALALPGYRWVARRGLQPG